MKLIITDDRKTILEQLEENLPDELDVYFIWCNAIADPELLPATRNNWFCTKDFSGLRKLLTEEIKIEEGNRYLFDVGLFTDEICNDKRYSEFSSVKVAKCIKEQEKENVKIQFFTHPEGVSVIDFARETGMNRPWYRPREQKNEPYAYKKFIMRIKEFYE